MYGLEGLDTKVWKVLNEAGKPIHLADLAKAVFTNPRELEAWMERRA